MQGLSSLVADPEGLETHEGAMPEHQLLLVPLEPGCTKARASGDLWSPGNASGCLDPNLIHPVGAEARDTPENIRIVVPMGPVFERQSPIRTKMVTGCPF